MLGLDRPSNIVGFCARSNQSIPISSSDGAKFEKNQEIKGGGKGFYAHASVGGNNLGQARQPWLRHHQFLSRAAHHVRRVLGLGSQGP